VRAVQEVVQEVPHRQPAVAVARVVQQQVPPLQLEDSAVRLERQEQPLLHLRFLRSPRQRLGTHQTRPRVVVQVVAAVVQQQAQQQVGNAVVAVGEAAVRRPLLPHQAPR
jgi:hypothetical protein